VQAEATAQWRALTAAGIRVAHIDSHRHVHALPGIRQGVAAAAVAAGISVVRVPVERGATLLGLAGPRLKARLLELAWRTGAGGAPAATRGFAGLALFHAGDAFAGRLLRVIDRLPPGPVEILVHPGYVDDALPALDEYRAPRETELRALLSAPLRHRLGAGL
jgi:predicted glycoside hydrolase/deacetylase ChbG (UPF0249 family)